MLRNKNHTQGHSGGGDGAEVIYALRNSNELATTILSELEKEGQNPRKVYQRRLPSDSTKDYYFIHRNTGNTEPVIVEYGFLDSTQDDVNQLKNNYENYAEAVVRAVLEYINVSYEPVEKTDLYIVKKGDTLWSIAKKFGLTVDELKKYNNLTNNLLNIGQILKVTKDVSTTNDIYTVKSKDTLYAIAKRFGITVNELKKYNNLTTDDLSIGEKLIIPTGQVTEEIITTDYDTYIVKSGDTLYSIANKYGVNIDELRNINNLSNDILTINQKLLIPKGKEIIDTEITNYVNYVVQKGDTLYSLARRYNITVDELRQINNLTDNDLSIGQVLKIPFEETTIYTVKNGDTLYSIARKYNTTVDELKTLNNLTNNILSVGQVLNVK